MSVQHWLDQWGIQLPANNAETCHLQVADDPELVLEKVPGGWLMAMRLGRLPSPMLLGVQLQLLQANGPFSALAPVHVAADSAGDLVLWVEVQEGHVDVPTLNNWYAKLCQGHRHFSPLLEAVPDQPRPASGARLFV
uniref:CesT family type III secretion system chaperone n=1 Tax=Pseudomonas lundensis TaxID=86185 RepID=UPI0028D87B3B|nr:CesT family type III secretion system chaperone [Pseudomonas lundensis]